MHATPALTAVLFGLRGCLVQSANGAPAPAPGALAILANLHQRYVPCIWLDEIADPPSQRMAQVLPDWLPGLTVTDPGLPAPNACWQALMQLGSQRLAGCVLGHAWRGEAPIPPHSSSLAKGSPPEAFFHHLFMWDLAPEPPWDRG